MLLDSWGLHQKEREVKYLSEHGLAEEANISLRRLAEDFGQNDMCF